MYPLYSLYLSKCEIVYKKKLQTSFSCSDFRFLSLISFPYDINKELDSFYSVKTSDTTKQIKSFFFFYLKYGVIPYVTLLGDEKNPFSLLKLRFCNKKINSFIFQLSKDLNYCLLNFVLNNKFSNFKQTFFLSSNFLNCHFSKYYLKTILGIANSKIFPFCLYFNVK